MRCLQLICSLILSGLVLTANGFGQNKPLTLDDLFDPQKRVNFNGNPPLAGTWLDDKHILQRGRKVNVLSGQSEPFFDVAKAEAAFAKLPGVTEQDAKRLAATAGSRMNVRRAASLINFANDLFYYQFGSETAIRLTNTAEEEVGEEFSPDGRFVSFVKNYNLYVVEIATQRERSLTKDGNSNLFNGRLDWVYQEEVYGRGNYQGYWWSPDSTRIAYLQLDESPVKDFTIVDHIPDQQELEVYDYPKAGTPNPVARLGVINAVGGETKWVDTFKYQSVEPLIVRVGWKPDGSKVWFAVTNREQNWLDFNFADPRTGKAETAFRETSKAWIESDNLT